MSYSNGSPNLNDSAYNISPLMSFNTVLSPLASSLLSSSLSTFTVPVFNSTTLQSPLTDESHEDSSKSGSNAIGMVLLVLILMVIIVGTIIGNILVCVAVCLVRKLRRPYNYLLVSLAVSDLCVAILVMPMALLHELLGEWQFGKMACDVWVSFDVLSCTASILNLCMISVDRYLAITKPLEYGVKRTPKRMVAYIVFVWISAAFISVPPVLILGNEHGDGAMCQVCQNFWYQIYATFGSFYIPLTVMVTVYYKIFQAAKRIVDEERKAQAHLRLVEEQGKQHSFLTKHPDTTSYKTTETNQRSSSQSQPQILTTSRCSFVEINNGEVETKLASCNLRLEAESEVGEWIPTAPNNTNIVYQKPMNHSNHQVQRPPSFAVINENDPSLECDGGSQLLEVPLGSHHMGRASPVSSITTCESTGSLAQAFELEDTVVAESPPQRCHEDFGDGVNLEKHSGKTSAVSSKDESLSSLAKGPNIEIDITTCEETSCKTSPEHLNKNVLQWTIADNRRELNEICVTSKEKRSDSCDLVLNSLNSTPERYQGDTTISHNSDGCEQHIGTQATDSHFMHGEGRSASDASSQALLGRTQSLALQENRSSGENSSTRRKFFNPPKSKLRITLAKERKASTTLGIIMSAFIICWLPFFVLALVRPFLADPSDIPNSVSSLFLWLGYANSLLNPIIYATLNRDFRKPFQEILCLRCSSLNILMREEFYHSQYGPDTPNHSHAKYSTNPKDQEACTTRGSTG